MATLNEQQILNVKEHMLHEETALKRRFKTKKSEFDTKTVPHSEVEGYENEGWIVDKVLKTKTKINRKKTHFRQFEDDIWCMFYNLGFRTLSADNELRIQWGNNEGEDKQIDVVAVGEDAIFVVECKSAESSKRQSFQKEITEICYYKDGLAESLRQIYGKDKRVRFIFATRNYRIDSEGDDAIRMKNNGIYHLDENGYNYICNLIKSYKESVVYQFYGMMFKDELINGTPITIPALKGIMGNKEYFLFSIEPSTLLKIGFVLHRTKVNDSMAPTYQRLLQPSRLKGITKFINGGGYFPNSVILNFAEPNEEIKLKFEPIHKEDGSASEFGLLHIPNAYGIAYIIDGQHRVYGYANSDYKSKHTVPVVAFKKMSSEEQLKIFMEINENQKSVSKNLRIDLEEDLYWTSSRLDSRMKALRSSTIKMLASQPSNVLYNKISVGEDKSLLGMDSFVNALLHSRLIPKATQTKWTGNTDTCLYDINETDVDKAMRDARKRIVQYINGCYEIADEQLTDDIKKTFLFSNRATYPFVTIIGLLHAHLCLCGVIDSKSAIKERVASVAPYVKSLCEGLNNLSETETAYMEGALGQGAEKKWLLSYQNIVNKAFPDYSPEELMEWKETRDEKIQAEGEKLKEDIRQVVKKLVFAKLQEVYGYNYEKNIAKLKNTCEGRILDLYGEDDDFDMGEYDWKDYAELNEFKDIVENNYPYDQFAQAFGIKLTDKDTSKTAKLSWFSLVEESKTKKKSGLTQSDINRLWSIYNHLNNHLPQEL